MKKLYFLLLLLCASASAQIVNIPDANFKLLLLQANAQSGLAYDSNGNAMTIDANGDGQIQVAEALQVYKLYAWYFGIMNFTGIEAFTNLRHLTANGNNAPTINVSTLTNLEYLELSGSNLSGLNLSGLTALTELNLYGPNIGNMNFASHTALQKLKVGGCGMTSINVSALTDLRVLNIQSNNITALDVSQNVLLDSLVTSQNPIPALNVSTLTNLKSLQCAGNDLMALNLSQNTQLTYLDMGTNEIPSMDFSANTQLVWLVTQNNPMPVLNVTMLPSLALLYCNNQGLSVLDLSNNPQLQNLDCSNNNLTALDVSAGGLLGALFCQNNDITSLDVSMHAALTGFNCSGNALTTIDISQNPMMCLFTASNMPTLQTVFMKNGNGGCPYETQLQGNPALYYVCTDETEIEHFQDLLGAAVAVNSYCNFTPGGPFNTITGTVLFDADGNGCDVLDAGQSFVKVGLDDGIENGSTFSDANGVYTFYTGAGNFTLSAEIENPSFFTITPVSGTANFPDANGSVQTINFCMAPNGTHHDVEVVLSPTIIPRPGFAAQYKIVYRNKGNQTESGVITFDYASAYMQLTGATQVPASASTGQYTFNYSNLMPFETREIQLDFIINAPTGTPPVNVGDMLDFLVSITQNGSDEFPSDNSFNFIQMVMGSFDPNDITCLEGAVVAPSEIGEYLHYLIRFENTGTWAAEKVVVKTEIDPSDYQVQSLQLLNASNPVNVRVHGNTAEYVFDNIQLAIGGHGNILLKIKSNSTLTTGSLVQQRADIFFDYNLPVDTGNANTVFQALAVKASELDAGIAVFPNPAQYEITVSAPSDLQSLTLYDVQGRVLQISAVSGREAKLDLASRAKGMYFLKVVSAQGSRVEKVLKN